MVDLIRDINFAQLPERFSSWKNSKVVVFPAPFGKTVTYVKGTEKGPQAIIDASKNIEWYDIELDCEPCRRGIYTYGFPEEKHLKNSATINRWVYDTTKRIVETEKFPILLGGEHSVSLGAIRYLSKRYKNLTVLSLDAHTDLRNKYEGSSYNHACVMRRVIDYARIVLVGVRSSYLEANKIIKKRKLKVFYPDDVLRKKSFEKKLLDALSSHVYITIDLDAFDPSIMPSVGTPEPGGLLWNNTLDILRSVARHRNVVGFDVVELSPNPYNVAPDFTAAKLIYKLIGYIFFNKI